MALIGNRRRTLIIVENLPSPFDRRVWQEATTLQRAGYLVTIICPTGRGYESRYEVIEGVHIHRYRSPFEADGALGYFVEYTYALIAQFLLALRVCFGRGFDVIHACNPPDNIFLVALPFKLFGVRFLFDHHDINPELYEAKFGRRDIFYRLMCLWERWTFRCANVSLATNESYRRIAIERGRMAPERVFVVRSGPDLARLRVMTPNPALKHGRRYLVGYVGVMGKQEGIDLLIESIRHIVQKVGRNDIHFTLVGGGTELERLRSTAVAVGVGSYVTFTGRVPDAELLAVLNTADVCVNPDRANAMNDKSTMNKIMEYMALGKPIVQFDLTEGRVSAQEAALYAKRNDPIDFADKIIELLDDERSRFAMGEIGRSRVQRELAWEYEAPRLIEAYETLFRGQGVSPEARHRWVINRLRTMSAAEIAHRSLRTVGQQVERLCLHSLGAPDKNRTLVTTRPLLGADGQAVIDEWNRRFRLDEDHLDEIIDGRVRFFGRAYQIDKPINWHRDPETGIEAPLGYGKTLNYRDAKIVGNIKVLWELGRHQHLVPLAVAYAVTGEPRYRAAVVDQIDSWILQNPFGLGIHWCSSLEVALRAIAWTMVHSLFVLRDGAGGLIAASRDSRALAGSLFHHGFFIRHFLSRHSSANNHLIGELVGLLCLSRCFGFGAESSRWAAFAAEALGKEAERQVYADGVAREQAVHYHLEVLEYLLFATCVARATGTGLSANVESRILTMAEFLTLLMPSGAQPPLIGDSDDATVNRLHPGDDEKPYSDALNAVHHVMGSSDACEAMTEKAFWYQRIGGHAPGHVAERVPNAVPAVRVFPQGGYAVLRTSELHLVFDAGPLGFLSIAAHGHADALSFCAAWKGSWWLVDPGTYAYHGDQTFRRYFRGTRAHNTATVNGANQSEMGGPFMWIRHAPARLEGAGESDGNLWAEGHHDGYRQFSLRHRRRIECRVGTGRCQVIDWFEGCPDGVATVDLYFHFAPDVQLTKEDDRYVATRPDSGDELEVRVDPRFDWQALRASTDPIAGWFSPRLGHKVPCWTLRGSWAAANDSAVVTAFSFRPRTVEPMEAQHTRLSPESSV